ncbi:iron chelate uptake ABC transporter family permease subunit, partial [Streptomyces sp. NPDC059641]|uniref:iron chelate uptake ABC transporter family permease subunit n=1 Tax=Streptomyces sp. NPDC059641 TaxID=3346892 RepID=UPI0036C0B9E6
APAPGPGGAARGAWGFGAPWGPPGGRWGGGAPHRRVLVVAPLAGAVLLVWADVVSRMLLAPAELPVGVITAVVGVPVFLLLMRRGGYAFGGR